DMFVRADGPIPLCDIELHLERRLSAGALSKLAEHAERQSRLFRPGRPWREYALDADQLDSRRAGLSVRAKFHDMANKSRGGPKASTRRARYYANKKARPHGE